MAQVVYAEMACMMLITTVIAITVYTIVPPVAMAPHAILVTGPIEQGLPPPVPAPMDFTMMVPMIETVSPVLMNALLVP